MFDRHTHQPSIDGTEWQKRIAQEVLGYSSILMRDETNVVYVDEHDLDLAGGFDDIYQFDYAWINGVLHLSTKINSKGYRASRGSFDETSSYDLTVDTNEPARIDTMEYSPQVVRFLAQGISIAGIKRKLAEINDVYGGYNPNNISGVEIIDNSKRYTRDTSEFSYIFEHGSLRYSYFGGTHDIFYGPETINPTYDTRDLEYSEQINNLLDFYLKAEHIKGMGDEQTE